MWRPSAPQWQGWRRTGTLNVLLTSVCAMTLFVCLSVSISKRESSSMSSTRIYEGLCGEASRMNTLLHLGLNIISTGILASSNFFMQIVTSASRKEIDQAHKFLRSLKIGLQSPTNLPFLSRTKQIGWIILLLSSIPIHLFFNSSIYTTAYQSFDWNVAIATEYFAQNGIENRTYWLPGASLAVSGSSSPAQHQSHNGDRPVGYSFFPNQHYPVLGFGNPTNYGYWNEFGTEVSDDTRQQIAATAQHCANWTRLSTESCMAEFRPYKYHTAFKNVVIVVSSGQSQAQGWRRDQVFEISFENTTRYWNANMPPDVVNSLWFWASCSVSDKIAFCDTADYIPGSSERCIDDSDFKEELRAYDHSCGRIFGLNTSQPPYHGQIQDDPVSLSFTDTGTGGNNTAEELLQGYKEHAGARNLQIDYCLAEPPVCQVRVSNTLILIVIICVVVKIVTCSSLLFALKDFSLVTPGDAIDSFISSPDPVTKGLASLSLPAAQGLESNPRQVYPTIKCPELTLAIRPRQWVTETRRVHSAVYRSIWVQSYYPIFLVAVALVVGIVLTALGGSGDYKTFGRSENAQTVQFGQAQFGYLTTLIIVNLPQVLLSFVYLTINTLYTQLQVEQEWNLHGRNYTPLRVSYPNGEQTTTYRLQLPYKYSIPLIVVSIFLHWVVSNSVFLLVVEGMASNPGIELRPDLAKDMGVSSDAMIAIGISKLSILIAFCVGLIFVFSPLFFRFRKLQNDMVVGGTNSLVLSAACHVPRIPRVLKTTSNPQDISSSRAIDDEKEYLLEVARGKVRWGAMSLPSDLAAKIEVHNDEPVMHLGFGTEEHNIQAPQTGTLYA